MQTFVRPSTVRFLAIVLALPWMATAADRPNVVLVITDDQGYGDIGAHGNSMIRTPNLDRLHGESVRLTDFHVDPTCSPTRSALMTGRYSTRTGVWHTIMGRSLMNGAEVTLAEVFAAAGYHTSMAGKWHLGDNAPLRPQDQGFQLAFYHGGGGVGQTPDFFGNTYFNDTYFRNGDADAMSGYCTDIWFDQAIATVREQSSKNKPFFVYLSTNAPHGPYFVDPSYSNPYADKGVPRTMANFYGMITNIDENVGRLVRTLDECGARDNTIFIFMTDNGTAAGVAPRSKAWRGFNAGMRGRKGSEYDGGHRVPFFIRWPDGGFGGEKGWDVDVLSAHIDVLPTLMELCRVSHPQPDSMDGTSLAANLKAPDAPAHERTLLVHSQRLEHPQKWRKSAVLEKGWRLVNGKELYDMSTDPGQKRNVADAHKDRVVRMRGAYESWWQSLTPVFGDYVRIRLGDPAENPAHLTCHDWHTNNKGVPWNHNHIRRGPANNGFWSVHVASAGRYRVTLRRWPRERPGPIEAVRARLRVGDVEVQNEVEWSSPEFSFDVELNAGDANLQTWLTPRQGKQRGAYFVSVEKLD